MTAKVFEAALGIGAAWFLSAVEFDEASRVLTVPVDFKPGTRFEVAGHESLLPVHDTMVKTYRHLNFFQHECLLHVRAPRVKLPTARFAWSSPTLRVGSRASRCCSRRSC
jgi:transposase